MTGHFMLSDVLLIAGSLKQGDKNRPEDWVKPVPGVLPLSKNRILKKKGFNTLVIYCLPSFSMCFCES